VQAEPGRQRVAADAHEKSPAAVCSRPLTAGREDLACYGDPHREVTTATASRGCMPRPHRPLSSPARATPGTPPPRAVMAKQNRGLVRWALSAAAQRCNLRTVSSSAAGVATLNRGMLCRHRRGRCHNGEAWIKNPGSCCLFRCKEKWYLLPWDL
jgi:hypothetical protein